MNIGDKIYYTGDICNQSGWFVVKAQRNANAFDLIETTHGENREFCINSWQVGDEYQGHCNPRFVTEQAYKSYYAKLYAAYERNSS